MTSSIFKTYQDTYIHSGQEYTWRGGSHLLLGLPPDCAGPGGVHFIVIVPCPLLGEGMPEPA